MELELNQLFIWFQIFAELPLHQEVEEQVFEEDLKKTYTNKDIQLVDKLDGVP